MVSLERHQVHVDRRAVGWSAGRHVDHPCHGPCGEQISPRPARKATAINSRKGGSSKFKKFLLEFIAFRLIPVICPARRAKPENCWIR